jgi:hypothetical protein
MVTLSSLMKLKSLLLYYGDLPLITTIATDIITVVLCVVF